MENRALPYADPAPFGELAADCTAVERELHLALGVHGADHPEGAWDLPRLEVSDELAAMAADLELHLG